MGNMGRSKDSVKYGKDCWDFACLDDGTIVSEYRYCNLSRMCRQVDFSGGKTIPMEAHYLPVLDIVTGEILEHDLFCTGMHDPRPLKERFEDDKAK